MSQRPRHPEPPVRDRQHWTAHEAVRFLQCRQDDPLAGLWWLALDSGMRRSELSSLLWSEVDLQSGVVTIQDPRSGRRRDVHIGTPTVSALRRLVMAQLVDEWAADDGWAGGTPGLSGHVVADPLGRACSLETLTRSFRQAQQGLGLPPIPFHGLRHTAFRVAVTSGASMAAVAERFGHLDAATTLEVWPHLVDGLGDDGSEGDQP